MFLPLEDTTVSSLPVIKGLTIPDLLRTFGNWRTNSKSSTCFFGLSTVSFPTKDAQIQINQTSIEPVIDGFIGFYLYSVGYGKLGVAYSFSSGSVCFVTYSLHQ
ncbi:protein of unknown function [Streptococcus thermophilus]|nr:protein of unknown function [Streptococcus thermophilus]CAD0125670.1 protein of unknown function [Streptococcus thermophilus]CAD0128559.1 protein of unknown function [Streptococcus thermophilus]CAD0135118.1 protein of unknown function [Streptococcus thermophilus]CAD0138834.1 protein of unknown function [Streptococcus thermophilus]